MNRVLVPLFLALFAVFALSGCVSNPSQENSDIIAQPAKNSSVEKVEIIHFHGTYQCYSCITVGDYAEETVKIYFSEEKMAGKVTFEHINGELPENGDIVMKYGATGSSLWIGVYTKDDFHKEENINVWYKVGNKENYMTYLKGIIEKRLNGDFS